MRLQIQSVGDGANVNDEPHQPGWTSSRRRQRHTFFKKIAGLRSSVSRTRQLSLF